MKSIVKDRGYEFALRFVSLARWLREWKEYELASQVLRSGTSIGVNVEEALAGVSRADFVAKMAIASKEARERHYWLRLLRDSKTVPDDRIVPLFDEAEQLVRIITAIVKTIQSNSNLKPQNLNTGG